ncbi:hypothetical protein [Thioalkalivibrio thiocyanodenitrificans]|uniref:hypothetical protein n=1 Tax=Thioalkalivibrio thiocyanodenitrificans TaxID=243063 RepID=UPI000368ADED|nr:hypothetical protein [Thioalkalivibrio thiocyanodenitrificans]
MKSILTTGAEWKRFLSDHQFWPPTVTFRNALIEIDGQRADAAEIARLDDIPNDASMKVSGGAVYQEGQEIPIKTLKSHFNKWRRQIKKVCLVIECPADKAEVIRKAALEQGAKIL